MAPLILWTVLDFQCDTVILPGMHQYNARKQTMDMLHTFNSEIVSCSWWRDAKVTLQSFLVYCGVNINFWKTTFLYTENIFILCTLYQSHNPRILERNPVSYTHLVLWDHLQSDKIHCLSHIQYISLPSLLYFLDYFLDVYSFHVTDFGEWF